MIVVLQTVDTTLARIRSLVGERGSVCYFGGHREALTHIRDNEPLFGRTVVIMSDFYPGEIGLNGSRVAAVIKGMRVAVWCILYTGIRPSTGPSVDGVISKLDQRVPLDSILDLVDAGIDDPERIPDLETLFTMFPWIQRPAR